MIIKYKLQIFFVINLFLNLIMTIIKIIKELFMKNNKQSNFIAIFGVFILSLGVAIACSTTGADD